jgi:hypothetical protein
MRNILNLLFKDEMRLIDVFITGPLQVYISSLIKVFFFKCFMLATGILNIMFNGYLFLLHSNYIKKPHPFLKNFISKDGKHQIHRLYNLTIMYPIFLYVLLRFILSWRLYIIFLLNIIIGFIYNLYFFYELS